MAAEKRDYYEVLGVEKNADEQAIKRAFKRLAMKYHPDRNQEPGAEEKFKEINEAYAVLSDEQKRAAYDQYGFAGVDPNQMGGAGGFGGADFGDMFGDIFGDIFGGAGRRGGAPREQPGSDIEQIVDITLPEAVKGVTKKIKVRTYAPCDTCHGSGCAEGGKSVTCPHCNGTGQVHMRQGFFAVSQPCPVCHGSGKKIDKPCPDCHGEGRVLKTTEVSVTIPAGVDTGNRMRLAGRGEAGRNGAPAGDLYIVIRVAPHDIFERDGLDLHVEVPVSFVTAALGGKVEVPTLDGNVSITIREGTQSGAKLRVTGRGVRSLRGGRVGDLYCHIQVETPVHLSAEQKEMLKNFERSLNGGKTPNAGEANSANEHSPKANSFFENVKNFFNDLKGN